MRLRHDADAIIIDMALDEAAVVAAFIEGVCAGLRSSAGAPPCAALRAARLAKTMPPIIAVLQLPESVASAQGPPESEALMEAFDRLQTCGLEMVIPRSKLDTDTSLAITMALRRLEMGPRRKS